MIKLIHLTLLLITISFPITSNAQGNSDKYASVPSSADSIKPLKVGVSIPDVTLATLDNKPVSLNSLVKQKPTVLIFYRGGWCPYCNRHLSELMKAEAELRKLGWQILAISPDKPENQNESREKKDLTYTLLSDSSMEASVLFGVAYKMDPGTITKYKMYGIDLEKASGNDHHLLPVPSVFLISKEGIIQYSHHNSNYKKRLSAEEIISAAKGVK